MGHADRRMIEAPALAMDFPTRRVGKTSLRLPVLGFGTAPLGGMFEAVDGTEGAATLAQALESGLTYVDTAP